jgi:hypothetical protein
LLGAGHWQAMLATSTRLLGAGQPAQAVAAYEQMVADASMRLGGWHPATLTGRIGLAQAYLAVGRDFDSVAATRRS